MRSKEREREKNETKVVLYAAMPFTKQLYFSLTYKINYEYTSYVTTIALQNYGFNIFFTQRCEKKINEK